MIESITVKSVASFDEHTGIKLDELKKVNFIYGSNGSGKTTISNFLADENNSLFNKCVLQWKGYLPLKRLVYNKMFREKNFRKRRN